MKKILVLISICFIGLGAFSSETEEVRQFFNSYVESGNAYKSDFFDYYAPNAIITRVVLNKDGSTTSVKVPMSEYKKQTKIGSKLGKLRGYKNKYTDIKIHPEEQNFRLTSMRKASLSNYSLPASFLIGKDSSGNLKIKEESMQTKVQSFLRKKHG